MTKVHIHTEQFDNAMHSWCGRGTTAVFHIQFEATPYQDRCKMCHREWFPNGQPDWHFKNAVKDYEDSKLLIELAMAENRAMKNMSNV